MTDNWVNQRVEDALFADHEDGHPDGGTSSSCHYCAEAKPALLTSIDSEIPTFDFGARDTPALGIGLYQCSRCFGPASGPGWCQACRYRRYRGGIP